MKKINIILGTLIILFSIWYYWNNRYVELHAVAINDIVQRPTIFESENYKILEREEAPENFYENIRFVLDHNTANYEDYIVKKGVVYIRYKDMNDLDLIWNFTKRTSDSIWLTQKVKEERRNLDVIEKSTGTRMENRYILHL
ncbi:hypothetical protein BC749_104343 [Flavobacterium araucananum]|uniref:Uncharacterized protein n=1 Tax=Flavobacterium araucananum TaxID=946678 RepID=A0A227PEE1_9FLAO|nr:hypothetical protein [Flavobacterium araucananum]OXG08290.1 hypothetical protein B0A64_05875 [Flavobacterium araucananum]PWJ99185.1 hypothetical protein BC749_104343 [Flavobacterium araucananum]